MSLNFTTAGRVAFWVTVTPRVHNLSRLIEAVFRTGARVSHAEILGPMEWRALVWLKVSSVPRFEHIALPSSFEHVSVSDVIKGK